MRQPTLDSSDEENPVKNPVRSIPPGYYRYIYSWKQKWGMYWKGQTIIGAFTYIFFFPTKKKK